MKLSHLIRMGCVAYWLFFLAQCSLFDLEQPVVVSTSPSNGEEEVQVGADIKIEFSLAMNQTMSENAFSIADLYGETPEGTLYWEDEGRTLVYDPKAAMVFGSIYQVNVDAAAEGANGRNIEHNYFFQFTVGTNIGPIEVVMQQPTNGAFVSNLSGDLLFHFSSPIDENIFGLHFSISPSLTYLLSIESNGVQARLELLQPLNIATTYTASFSENMQDIYGNKIDEPYSAFFIAGTEFVLPTVVQADSSTVSDLSDITINSNVEKTDAFAFVFSEEMDLDSFIEHFVFSDGVSGSYVVSGVSNHIISFTPDDDLDSETLYFMTLGEEIKDSQGNGLSRDTKYFIYTDGLNSTFPTITNIQDNGGTDLDENDVLDLSGLFATATSITYENLLIQFSKDVSEASVYGNTSVQFITGTGSGGGSVFISDITYADDRILIDLSDLKPGNFYKVVISGGSSGLRDEDGNFLEQDFEFLIRT